MRIRLLLFGISVLANVGLTVAYFVGPAARPAPLPTAGTPAAPGVAGLTAAAPAPISPPPVRDIPAGFSWSTVETSDLEELAARLKAAGFSPTDIRTILQQRISQLGAINQAAATPSPYWRANRMHHADPTAAAELRKTMAEQARLYRRFLYGPEGFDDPARVEGARRQWGDLPVDKLKAIAAIESDYQELTLQQFAKRRYQPGEERADDATLQRMIQQERLADIARVLSPEEFAAFELRASPTALALRYRLETFRATEEEYRAIFAINKAYESRVYDPALAPAARKALNEEINARVGELLGAERAADYDAAMNHNSQDQTARLVSRLNLPARVAVEVRQMQKDFTQRANELRENSALAAVERNAQLESLARQAERQLATQLGSDGFEVYNDLKGEWIRAIRPKPGD